MCRSFSLCLRACDACQAHSVAQAARGKQRCVPRPGACQPDSGYCDERANALPTRSPLGRAGCRTEAPASDSECSRKGSAAGWKCLLHVRLAPRMLVEFVEIGGRILLLRLKHASSMQHATGQRPACNTQHTATRIEARDTQTRRMPVLRNGSRCASASESECTCATGRADQVGLLASESGVRFGLGIWFVCLFVCLFALGRFCFKTDRGRNRSAVLAVATVHPNRSATFRRIATEPL